MTEEEWLNAAGPKAIVPAVGGQPARKRRLWAIACVRRLVDCWNGFGDFYAAALGAGDAYADDAAQRAALVAVRRRVAAEQRELESSHDEYRYYFTCICWAVWLALDPADVNLAELAIRVSDATHDRYERPDWEAEDRVYGSVARCVFGNPYRSVASDRRWRTADVLGMARGIYEERAFDRLPILADALQDAGCADEQLLGHGRGPGPHVRGYWVVDLVLGKA